MVIKGWIHGELGKFEIYLWNSVKSDNELRLEIERLSIKKDNSIVIPRNQKSGDLDENSLSNRSLKLGENSYRDFDLKQKLKQN